MQFEFCDAQDASWCEVRWMSVSEHTNAAERFLARVMQLPHVAQVKLARKKLRSRAIETLLLNFLYAFVD